MNFQAANTDAEDPANPLPLLRELLAATLNSQDTAKHPWEEVGDRYPSTAVLNVCFHCFLLCHSQRRRRTAKSRPSFSDTRSVHVHRIPSDCTELCLG